MSGGLNIKVTYQEYAANVLTDVYKVVRVADFSIAGDRVPASVFTGGPGHLIVSAGADDPRELPITDVPDGYALKRDSTADLGVAWGVTEAGGASGLFLGVLSARLTLSGSAWVDLLAPVEGVASVRQVLIYNTGAQTCKFGIKIVRSGVDYVTIEKSLNQNEGFFIQVPVALNSTTKIQARTNHASGAGYVECTYETGLTSGTGLANITGTTFTDVLTVASGKTYSVAAIILQNKDTVPRDLEFQITNSINTAVFGPVKRSVPAGAWYIHEFPHVLTDGFKVRAKTSDAAAVVGCAAVYEEV